MAKRLSTVEKRKRKPLICKLGFHKVDRENYYVRRNKTIITSRTAYCKRCGKRLYLVDKYGERKEGIE